MFQEKGDGFTSVEDEITAFLPKKTGWCRLWDFFSLFVLEVWLQPIINRCLCAIWLPFKAVLKNEPGLSGFGWVIIALIQCFLLVVHVSLWYAFHTLFREEISLPCCSEEERLPLISMALPHPLIKQHYRKIFFLTVLSLCRDVWTWSHVMLCNNNMATERVSVVSQCN